jgi:hypothetical protein
MAKPHGITLGTLSARSEVMPLMDVGLIDLPGSCTDEAFSPLGLLG